MRSSALAAVVLSTVACGDPHKPLEPDGSARAGLTTPPTHERPSASAPPAASSSAKVEDLACRKGKTRPYGERGATPAEVREAIAKMTYICAPGDWLVEALTKCMERMGQPDVTVRHGVMDGDDWTPNACDISLASADWNGRRWITFNNDIREGHTYFEYVSAMELTKGGPIVSTQGCQRYGGEISGSDPPRVPPGWSTFPDKLKARLCF